MVEKEMTEEERWDQGVSTEQTKVRKFVFEDEAGVDLGIMYLDLHPREGKYSHAAHFTVRCGCALDPDGGAYQVPIVALVCNMSPPEGNPWLNHAEVETLFHEFGHGLHSLLSRTTFQHVSGTRAAMDFVETPSHLFEQYAWDPAFLKILGRHYVTGESIPDDLISRLNKSRNAFRCIEVQNQILYSRFDQALFGIPDDKSRSTTEMFAALYHENGIPYAPGTHWHSRFSHLVTYGAGYYGYLYAQVFASDIWGRVLMNDSLDRQAGDLIWREVLVHGGAKDPNVMLRTVLGRAPSGDTFFASMKV
mmetsp:Transcript_24438/g.56951  ORF Transcript_24438/g.56951 Transcript_24438/m.56951 type:complete len:306 (+) Transcript_24438:3-920(+)